MYYLCIKGTFSPLLRCTKYVRFTGIRTLCLNVNSDRNVTLLKQFPVLTRHLHGNTTLNSSKTLTNVENDKDSVENEDNLDLKEKFIPLTRRSLLRFLMQENNSLTDEELRHFEKFSTALDAAIINRYYGLLHELKDLFDPINPDKDTIQTRDITRKECLDNEFWLLQKLANVMERANFNELPKPHVLKSIANHKARDGVMVSVDPDRYDVLRYWALGREIPQETIPWYKSLYYKVRKQSPPKPLQYYKRIVVAMRLKRDQKLMLKMFKQVPFNALEQLLPDGKIRMANMDKNIIKTTIVVASSGLVIKLIGALASQNIQWSLILSGASAIVALQAWTVYQNRKRSYLVDLTRMLYFKNIANNRGLLTLLVDRARDEIFKEALLVYTILLINRPPGLMTKPSDEHLPVELGGISTALLEQQIENWIYDKTKLHIDFDCDEAVNLLKSFGLVSESDDVLNVLPLAISLRHLPQQPQVLLQGSESDVSDIEGYDRDAYVESEKELKRDDDKSRKYGWF